MRFTRNTGYCTVKRTTTPGGLAPSRSASVCPPGFHTFTRVGIAALGPTDGAAETVAETSTGIGPVPSQAPACTTVGLMFKGPVPLAALAPVPPQIWDQAAGR